MGFPKHKTAIVLIGLPGAGKSTWAKKFSRQHPEAEFKLLSMDNYMDKHAAVFRSAKVDAWDVLSPIAFGELMEETNKTIGRKANLIFDRCNIDEIRRDIILSHLDASWAKIAVHFKVPDHICRTRVESRMAQEGKTIDEEFQQSLRRRHTPPGKEFDLVVEVNQFGSTIGVESHSRKGNALKSLFPIGKEKSGELIPKKLGRV